MSFPPPHAIDRLVGTGVVRRLEWHESTGSTNADVSAAAAAGEPAGLVIGTDLQTAGRGRRGRSWTESAGRGLALSVLLRPSLPPSRWPLLPLVAGLAVHDAAALPPPGSPEELPAGTRCLLEWSSGTFAAPPDPTPPPPPRRRWSRR
ncbi:MAG: hypothetical protein ABGZ36_10190 [Actinomycetota bacterium]